MILTIAYIVMPKECLSCSFNYCKLTCNSIFLTLPPCKKSNLVETFCLLCLNKEKSQTGKNSFRRWSIYPLARRWRKPYQFFWFAGRMSLCKLYWRTQRWEDFGHRKYPQRYTLPEKWVRG